MMERSSVDMEQNNDIRANVAAIRAKMAEAAASCGRDVREIKLCAATKMNDAARVKEAVAAGVDCCGENRVQELLEKQPQGAYEGAPVHFIGHLQTNKVKYLVGVVDLIESVDRPELLECIEKQAEKVGVKRVETGAVKPLSAWVKRPKTTHVFPPFTGAFGIGENNADVRDKVADGFLCSLMCCGNDFQHLNQTALFSGPQASAGSYSVVKANFDKSMAVHAARRLATPTWTNNRDQLRAPEGELPKGFFTDCAVWSAFSDSNNCCSFENVPYKGENYRVRNQLFPFTIADVETWGVPLGSAETSEGEAFFATWLKGRRLSADAAAVMKKARAFYEYCYVNQFAPIWDAGYMQLKNAVAEDAEGKKLLAALKTAHKKWSAKLLKDVISYSIIPEDVQYFDGAPYEED